MARRNPHDGSTFESFLEDEGLLAETREHAIKTMLAWQLARTMADEKISKSALAKRLDTSRSQLDRLLDPRNDNVTLATLAKAARAVGKRLRVDLVDGDEASGREQLDLRRRFQRPGATRHHIRMSGFRLSGTVVVMHLIDRYQATDREPAARRVLGGPAEKLLSETRQVRGLHIVDVSQRANWDLL